MEHIAKAQPKTQHNQLVLKEVYFLGVYCFLVLMSMNTFQVGSYQDDALYINLARAISSGAGYVDLPSVGTLPHTYVPPVYPLLLSPILAAIPYEWLLQHNFFPLQILSVVLMSGTIAVFSIFINRYPKQTWGWILALMIVNPSMVGTGIQVMSEVPYLFLTIAAIASIDRWEQSGRKNHWLLAGGLAAAVLASLTRLVGATILVALALYLLPRIPWKKWLISLAVLFLPYAAFLGRNLYVGASLAGNYTSQLTQTSIAAVCTTIFQNTRQFLITIVPEAIFPLLSGPRVTTFLESLSLAWLPSVIGVTITAVILYGLILHYQHEKNQRLSVYYTGIYFTAIMYAKIALAGGTRYIFPILPFLILYFVTGFFALFEKLSSTLRFPFQNQVAQICIAGICMLSLARCFQGIIDPSKNRIPDISLGTSWIYANSPADSIIMADYDRHVYLYAQRKVVDFPSGNTAEGDLFAAVECTGADYILLQPDQAPTTQFELSAAVQASIQQPIADHPEYFVAVYENEEKSVWVYQVQEKLHEDYNAIACTLQGQS